jgi:hypothetical protein
MEINSATSSAIYFFTVCEDAYMSKSLQNVRRFAAVTLFLLPIILLGLPVFFPASAEGLGFTRLGPLMTAPLGVTVGFLVWRDPDPKFKRTFVRFASLLIFVTVFGGLAWLQF